MSLTEFDEEEFIRNRREEGWNKATAEMQPIIDKLTSEISQQAAEIAALKAQIAELQGESA